MDISIRPEKVSSALADTSFGTRKLYLDLQYQILNRAAIFFCKIVHKFFPGSGGHKSAQKNRKNSNMSLSSSMMCSLPFKRYSMDLGFGKAKHNIRIMVP